MKKIIIILVVMVLLISYVPENIEAQGTRIWNKDIPANCNYLPPLKIKWEAEKFNNTISWSVRVTAGECVIKGYGTAQTKQGIKGEILKWGENKGTLKFRRNIKKIDARYKGNFTKT